MKNKQTNKHVSKRQREGVMEEQVKKGGKCQRVTMQSKLAFLWPTVKLNSF